VPDGDRERVTEWFVRLDRSRTIAGHGLGLNMIAAIARAHEERSRYRMPRRDHGS
jgi:hypothetical protein